MTTTSETRPVNSRPDAVTDISAQSLAVTVTARRGFGWTGRRCDRGGRCVRLGDQLGQCVATLCLALDGALSVPF